VTSEPTKASTIELNLQNVSQLFETLDPHPFLQRDLDKDAEEFIVGWARELPRDHAFKVVVHLPKSEIEAAAARTLADAVRSYFLHRAEAVGRDLRQLFRVGRLSLVIGVGVLAACTIAAQYTEAVLGDGPFAGAMREGLIILGWVANWRPIEIFLYDWWPISRQCDLYRRLAKAEIQLNPV
jgi:hypothetical protein